MRLIQPALEIGLNIVAMRLRSWLIFLLVDFGPYFVKFAGYRVHRARLANASRFVERQQGFLLRRNASRLQEMEKSRRFQLRPGVTSASLLLVCIAHRHGLLEEL